MNEEQQNQNKNEEEVLQREEDKEVKEQCVEKKKKTIPMLVVVGIIILFFIVVGVLVWIWYFARVLEVTEVMEKELKDEILEFSEFNDTEIGISFKFPKSWGEAVVKNDFFTVMGNRKIYFTNQPKIILDAITYDNYPKEDIKYLCNKEILESAGG